MCCYKDNSLPRRERKKGSSKQKNNTCCNNDSQNHSGSLRTKVFPNKNHNKKKETKLFSKEKCRHYEMPLVKELLSDDYSKNNNTAVSIRNKYSRSTNILSYETPSWRF